ncbi:DUF998 domain-containing protein [Prauserella cavernicola]|uniref:DUF998 domain-containing protein n=1 Tax=Prauserella cavernicola TaxID=2800127 RepID=UPI0027DC7FD4|nr:DUF998 domain-containing protein [Prauserella cavernicola]
MGVATLAHLGWALEFVLDTGLSPAHSAPDDLSAPGQPYRELFRALELVAGIAFLLSCAPLARLAPVQWQARSTIAVIAVLGVVLVARSAFTLDCAGALTGACTADFSPAHHVHVATSVLLHVIYVAGPLSLLLWWEGRWRVVPVLVAAVESAALLAVVVVRLVGSGQFLGLVLRLQLLAGTAVLVTGAFYLFTVARDVRDRWQDARQ